MDAKEKKTYPYPWIFVFILSIHFALFFLNVTYVDPYTIPTNKGIRIRVIDDLKRQIVESEDSENRLLKKDAYLSDKTRSFDRQTKSKNVNRFSDFKDDAMKKSLRFSDLGSLVNQDPFHQAARRLSQKSEKKTQSSHDFLPHVPEGDLTQLNTVEYKYYGFYHRIKQKLEQFWEKRLYEKTMSLENKGRRIASDEELLTALEVILNDKGEIISIQIKETCGIKEFDEAAVESFHEAGPFPNPPKDLIINGRVKLDWGFVVRS